MRTIIRAVSAVKLAESSSSPLKSLSTLLFNFAQSSVLLTSTLMVLTSPPTFLLAAPSVSSSQSATNTFMP